MGKRSPKARSVKLGKGSRGHPPPDPFVCPPRIVIVPVPANDPGLLDAISVLLAIGRRVRAEQAAEYQDSRDDWVWRFDG